MLCSTQLERRCPRKTCRLRLPLALSRCCVCSSLYLSLLVEALPTLLSIALLMRYYGRSAGAARDTNALTLSDIEGGHDVQWVLRLLLHLPSLFPLHICVLDHYRLATTHLQRSSTIDLLPARSASRPTQKIELILAQCTRFALQRVAVTVCQPASSAPQVGTTAHPSITSLIIDFYCVTHAPSKTTSKPRQASSKCLRQKRFQFLTATNT
jgi:hypothetical protein